MTSLKRRLSLGLALFLTLLMLLQWLLVSVVFNRLTESQLTERMENEISSVLGGLEIDPFSGEITLNTQHLSSLYNRPFSGRYYVVCSLQNCLQSRSLWDERINIDRLNSGEQQVVYLPGPQNHQLFTVISGFYKSGQDITIAVGEDIKQLRDDIKQFNLIFTLMSAGGLIILLLMQWLIVRTALLPLNKIKQQLIQLGRGEAEKIEAQGPDEIMPMVTELNGLLNTLSRKTHRSRVALGNLAHALKSRLTVLNQLTENPVLNATPDVKNAFIKTHQEVLQIIERELKQARLVGGSVPGQRVNLQQEISDLCVILQQMYREKRVKIDWFVDEQAKFMGDREDLLELLGNVLDNACKWCQKHIEIRVIEQSGWLIEVIDDGPSCESEQLQSLTRRGFRADESTPGSGLGLAIVYDIVESYDGTLAFSQSARLGGLQVNIWLPQTRQS